MSAYSFIEFIKQVGERNKMRVLPSILSLFRNRFNKFNNTRAGMLDSILSYDIKITLKSHFYRKNDMRRHMINYLINTSLVPYQY